jgi:hypothetical protein
MSKHHTNVAIEQSSIDWLYEQWTKRGTLDRATLHAARHIHRKEVALAATRGYLTASDQLPLKEAVSYGKAYYKVRYNR